MATEQQTRHVVGGDQTTSEAILAAVAAREGVTPAELERPLYEVVDPEALDDLVRSIDATGAVEFEYYGYDLTVHGDGRITIRRSG